MTSCHQRHKFFYNFLSRVSGINLLEVFIEKNNKLFNQVKSKKLIDHLNSRKNVEDDFFKTYNNSIRKNIKITNVKNKNYYTSLDFLNKLKKINPDLLVVFGSSILKGDIVKLYNGRILNLHLGLSPYYRGSGTNYFALVNNKPELFGSTILYLDEGIDTGKIIHQLRPSVFFDDNIHLLGNRLIIKSTLEMKKIILNYKKLKKITKKYKNLKTKFFKRADFTVKSLYKLHNNFKKGMLSKYLRNKKQRDMRFGIIQQKN
jgi:phosphoribosylglycinamide formyltransferase-1